MSRSHAPVAVDLFAGCGGLSLGLTQAGFDVAAAVEIDEVAAQTYAANHSATVLNTDVRNVTSTVLKQLSPTGRIDLLAGCAPCQGFCSLTAKNVKEDPRNRLLLEMARLVSGLRPTVLFMENVPGLLTRGANVFEEFLCQLSTLGYEYQYRVVQMADYGVPQYRRRLVLLAGRGFCVEFPKARYAKRRSLGARPWRTLRETIYGEPAPTKWADAMKRGGPRKFDWNVVRTLQPQTKARLRAAVPGKTWLAVDEQLRPDCHRGEYRGFTNVYQRMTWDQTSPTITSGCTTPAKGRFGHPDRRRTTISVREAAIIQSFPKSYRFDTDEMDAVCEMIGNAVPPRFAREVGRSIRDQIRACRD